jgi:integrase
MRIRGINRVRSKGTLYLYDRKTGIRLKSDPNDVPAILAELATIRGTAPAETQQDGTLGGLIAAYRASPEFSQLKPRTRSDYDQVFDYWKPLHAMQIERFNRGPFILAMRDRAFRKHKRRFANYCVQVASLLLTWAKPRGWVETNAAMDAPRLRRPKGMARANRPWTERECATVLAEAPSQLMVPIAIGMFLAPREQDVIAFPRNAYDGARIKWTAQKNDRKLWLRAHPTLREILDGVKKHATIFCLTSRKTAWTESGFRASFFKLIRRLVAEGKVAKGLTFHGLRHTLGDRLSDAGCDTRDIAAVLGITEKQAEHYSKGGDQRKRADAALLRLERKRK